MPKSRKRSAGKASKGVKTSQREKIAIWLNHEQLYILRKWRDTESLNIAAFIRKAVTDAINKKTG